MKRKLPLILTTFLLLATSTLWVHSYAAPYWVAYHRMRTLYMRVTG